MKIINTKFAGLKVIQNFTFPDERGYFRELISEKEIKKKFLFNVMSFSKKNVLRGLHYDDKTWKLVNCIHGKIYLVVLDVRPHSTTYGEWESFILSPETGTQVLIPPMFANGHFVMK